jgi:hypothetical protein
MNMDLLKQQEVAASDTMDVCDTTLYLISKEEELGHKLYTDS